MAQIVWFASTQAWQALGNDNSGTRNRAWDWLEQGHILAERTESAMGGMEVSQIHIAHLQAGRTAFSSRRSILSKNSSAFNQASNNSQSLAVNPSGKADYAVWMRIETLTISQEAVARNVRSQVLCKSR
jgi:hypothetical protein